MIVLFIDHRRFIGILGFDKFNKDSDQKKDNIVKRMYSKDDEDLYFDDDSKPKLTTLDLFEVSKQYNKDKIAVKEVTFKLTEREIVGILGPNGAGKSSLFSIIGMI